jgi:DNA replication protein DnaC
MRNGLERRVAAVYAARREKAERDRAERVRSVHATYPELIDYDRAISDAGARMLSAVAEPGPMAAARVAALAEEKTRLVANRGAYLLGRDVELDFDRPHWICAVCRDTGLVDEDPPTGNHQRCRCHDAILIPMLFERANLGVIDGMSFERFDPTLFSNQPDKEHFQSDLSPRANINGIRKACETFCDEFDAPVTRDMLFVGRPGTGKTFLCGAVADRMLQRTRSVLYMSAPSLFEAISNFRTLTASFHPDEDRLETATETYDRILECELLIIDDLGTEMPSSARIPELLSVLNTRMGPRHGTARHTIVATNLEAKDIRDGYDERVLSRLYGAFAVYRFYGEDLRQTLRQRRTSASRNIASGSGRGGATTPRPGGTAGT